MGLKTSNHSSQPSLLHEAIGTFLITLVGTSALTALSVAGQATTASVMLLGTIAFSLPLTWLLYVNTKQLLPQFNPAITLYHVAQGNIPIIRSFIIIATQVLSAIAASVVVALLHGSAGVEALLGAPLPNTGMGEWAAVVAEMIGVGILVASYALAQNRSKSAGQSALIIGLGFSIGYLVSAGISGGALNPARAIAPQLAAAQLTDWWVYWLGPLLGVALTTLLVKFAMHQKEIAQPSPQVATHAPTLQPASLKQPVEAESQSQPQPTKTQDQALPQKELYEELQRKAKLALESLKQDDSSSNTDSSHKPNPILKPSFYPLEKDTSEQSVQPADTKTNDNEPVSQADEMPEKPTPDTSGSIKFVTFENPEDH